MRTADEDGLTQVFDQLWLIWLIGAALFSISAALWCLYFTLDDLAWRVRLVGVALRHVTPLAASDRPASEGPQQGLSVERVRASGPQTQAGAAPAEESR